MKHFHKSSATVLAAILLLSACGGGGSDESPPAIALVSGSEVPVSATESAAGTTAFVAQQVVATSDSADPVVLGSAVLATDDSAEPSDV
jgi:hypothetical protein